MVTKALSQCTAESQQTVPGVDPRDPYLAHWQTAQAPPQFQRHWQTCLKARWCQTVFSFGRLLSTRFQGTLFSFNWKKDSTPVRHNYKLFSNPWIFFKWKYLFNILKSEKCIYLSKEMVMIYCFFIINANDCFLSKIFFVKKKWW